VTTLPHDITPLTNALEETTAGSQSEVYTLLAAWNQSIDAALERGGGSRFRDVMSQYCPQVIDLVDVAAATGDGVEDGADVDWAFIQECVEAYPQGVGDHHSSAVLANVLARDVIRTRITQSPAAIPKWVIDYLQGITMEEDTEWAWESALAVGWGVGHPDVAGLDRVVERAGTDRGSIPTVTPIGGTWSVTRLPTPTSSRRSDGTVHPAARSGKTQPAGPGQIRWPATKSIASPAQTTSSRVRRGASSAGTSSARSESSTPGNTRAASARPVS
jgi:hypothetical protein